MKFRIAENVLFMYYTLQPLLVIVQGALEVQREFTVIRKLFTAASTGWCASQDSGHLSHLWDGEEAF